jgi:aquaporin Z
MFRLLLAETTGTFLLVLLGCGAIIIDVSTAGALGLLGLSIAWGLIVTLIVFAFAPISGAHINPAMTLGLALDRRFAWSMVLPYIVAQCVGAVLAAILLRLLFPESGTLGQTLPAGAELQSFAFEVVITFVLMLIVLRFVAGPEGRETQAGLSIGFTVLALVAFAGPVSGASINPARSIGPALVAGDLTSLWIYLSAPFLGAVLGVLFHRLLTPSTS